jgi:hypothetical protein
MAPETPTKTTLTRSEDWEKWFWDLQANVSDEIWSCINPEGPETALLELPRRPELTDFNQQARIYAELSAVHQKSYDNARRYYDQDMKYYSRQRDQLQAARAYITSTVSQAKKTSLDPKLSVREWLVKLKKDTEPPKGYMLMQIETRYHDTLKSFKSNKLVQWLEEWETIMVECIKYELPEVKNGRWLRDLALRIRPMSEVYYVQFMKDANDDAKSDPLEFRRVARELREMLGTRSGGRTVRGGAFNASFGPTEPSDDSSDTIHFEEAEQAPPQGSKGRKRPGTSYESNASKKVNPECPACGMRGHSLPECWCIFEELRPEGAKSSSYRVRKANKALADNEELSRQVQEIRQKMEKKKVAAVQ